MVTVHALIPARSGSKGIPHKCIKSYRGLPLMAHSIEQALSCPLIDRVVVTTDSREYADIAQQYGADAPFLRPAQIAGDLSTDLEFFQHYLQWLEDNDYEIPDAIVQLRPTYPNRPIRLLTTAVASFIDRYQDYDSLRTVVPFEKSPLKMYTVENNTLIPLFKKWGNLTEPYNRCRQELPQCYIHNGCIDIVKSSVIIEKGSVTGDRILPLMMEDNHDIDTLDDWAKSESSI